MSASSPLFQEHLYQAIARVIGTQAELRMHLETEGQNGPLLMAIGVRLQQESDLLQQLLCEYLNGQPLLREAYDQRVFEISLNEMLRRSGIAVK